LYPRHCIPNRTARADLVEVLPVEEHQQRRVVRFWAAREDYLIQGPCGGGTYSLPLLITSSDTRATQRWTIDANPDSTYIQFLSTLVTVLSREVLSRPIISHLQRRGHFLADGFLFCLLPPSFTERDSLYVVALCGWVGNVLVLVRVPWAGPLGHKLFRHVMPRLAPSHYLY
jgi:hypothetical protein